MKRRSYFEKNASLMRRLLLGAGIVFCFQTIPVSSYASDDVSMQQQQTITVSGTVVDQSGSPLPGVNVYVQGTTVGTITDSSGKYSLSAAPDQTLVYSFIGYTNQVVKIDNRSNIDVVLVDDLQQVGEVVVVGFGTQKKANLTGAVSNVNVDKALSSKPINDVSKGLQGITPGLTITYNSGALNSSPTINLRGAGTIVSGKQSGSPLVLVDGIPMDMSLVNPDDVASISVLKDAASASIYGARAAFGVLLITTKSGKSSDKVNISYSNNFAWNTPTKLVDFSDPEIELPALINAKLRDGQAAEAFGMDFATLLPGIKRWKENYAHNRKGNEMVYGEDWEIINKRAYFYRVWDPNKEMISNWTPQQTHNVAANGRLGENSSFNASVGYSSQEGSLKLNPEEMQRYNVNFGVSTPLTKWLKADFKTLATRQSYDYPYNYYDGTGFDRTNGYFGYYQRWGSFFPYGTYKGKYFRHAPGYLANANTSNITTDYLRIGTTLTAEVTKELNFIAEYSMSTNNSRRKNVGGVIELWDFWSPFNPDNIDASLSQLVAPGSQHDRVSYVDVREQTQVFNAYANYNKRIGEWHNVKVTAGTNIEWNEWERIYAERRGLMDSSKGEIGLGTGAQYVWPANSLANPGHTEYAIAGFFGRVNYDFKGKYLLEFNGRMDGSSKFPSSDPWAFFPSGSVGYRITEEDFMQFSKSVLSDLKLRASIGSIGNQNIRNNAFLPVMTNSTANWITNGTVTPSVNTPSVVDANLSWEKVVTYDLGADAQFLNGMFGLTFDWYQRNTTGMLAPGKVLPDVFGASAPETNAGDLRTQGYEIALDWNYKINSKIDVYAQATLSDYQTEVTKWNNPSNLISDFYSGMVLGEIWGFETDRLFQVSDFDGQDSKGVWIPKAGIASQASLQKGNFKFGPGDVKYANLNDDEVIGIGKGTKDDHGDLKVIGNTTPRYQYGIRLGGNFYGFDVDMFFQGVGKRDYWATSDLIQPLYNRTDALYQHQLDFWTPENTDAFFPNPYAGHATNAFKGVSGSNNFMTQSRYLTDLSYFRFKNLTIGYTLPNHISKLAYMQKVRVYFSAQNIAEIVSDRLPVDPETDEAESQWGRTFPYTRTVSFGLQVNF